MGRESGQELSRLWERVITDEAELRQALVETFIANANSGRHADNDEMILRYGQWQRNRRRSR